MTSKEFDRIEATNRKIVDGFVASYPVKVGMLARELGVTVKIASLRPGISGQITKEDGNFIVRVNRYEARERQRFTIAHELAHFLLHRPIIESSPDGITDSVLYRSGGAPERIEYEANRLAADLVMPLELVKGLLKDSFGGMVTEASIEGLAERFEVSKAAMEIRLAAIQGS